MATALEKYKATKESMNAAMDQGVFQVEHLLQYQELCYRINVLETCMSFCKTAPITPDIRPMTYHYQLLEAILKCMLQERRLGFAADEAVQKKRDTAYGNLQNVVDSFRKQMSSFAPTSEDAYRNAISKMVNSILAAWVGYRNTYVNV